MTGFREMRNGCYRARHELIQTEVKSIEIIHWQQRQAVMLYSCFEKKAATGVTALFSLSQ